MYTRCYLIWIPHRDAEPPEDLQFVEALEV